MCPSCDTWTARSLRRFAAPRLTATMNCPAVYNFHCGARAVHQASFFSLAASSCHRCSSRKSFQKFSPFPSGDMGHKRVKGTESSSADRGCDQALVFFKGRSAAKSGIPPSSRPVGRRACRVTSSRASSDVIMEVCQVSQAIGRALDSHPSDYGQDTNWTKSPEDNRKHHIPAQAKPSWRDSQANVVRLQTCRLHWNSSPEGVSTSRSTGK